MNQITDTQARHTPTINLEETAEAAASRFAGELVKAESRIFALERAIESYSQRDDHQQDIIESLRGSLAREQEKNKPLAGLNPEAVAGVVESLEMCIKELFKRNCVANAATAQLAIDAIKAVPR